MPDLLPSVRGDVAILCDVTGADDSSLHCSVGTVGACGMVKNQKRKMESSPVLSFRTEGAMVPWMMEALSFFTLDSIDRRAIQRKKNYPERSTFRKGLQRLVVEPGQASCPPAARCRRSRSAPSRAPSSFPASTATSHRPAVLFSPIVIANEARRDNSYDPLAVAIAHMFPSITHMFPWLSR